MTNEAVLTETDNLLIYYAGHGTLDGDVGFWQGIDAEPSYEDNWVSQFRSDAQPASDERAPRPGGRRQLLLGDA